MSRVSALVKRHPAHDVLRPGLRVVLVGVDPLCTWGLSQSGRKLRALSCCARRTGAHGGQGWSAGPVSQNDSLACFARMVRGGAVTASSAYRCRNNAQRHAGCSSSVSSPTRRLAWHPLHFCNRPSRSRRRRRMGGARLEGLRSSPVAARPVGTGCQPDPRRSDRRLASASHCGWAGQLPRYRADSCRSDRLQLGVQQCQRQRVDHHVDARRQ